MQPLDLSISKTGHTTIPNVWPESHFEHLYETAVLVLTDLQGKRRKPSACEDVENWGGDKQRQTRRIKCRVCKRFIESESFQEHMDIVHKYLCRERGKKPLGQAPVKVRHIKQHVDSPASTNQSEFLDETTGLLLVKKEKEQIIESKQKEKELKTMLEKSLDEVEDGWAREKLKRQAEKAPDILVPRRTKSSPEHNLSIKIRLLEGGGAQIIEVSL